MADRPKRKKRERDPVRMTSDELMDHLFDPKVRKELKRIAHESRSKPKPSK